MARTRTLLLSLLIWWLAGTLGWAAPDTEPRSTAPDVTSLEEVVVTAKRIPGLSVNPRELPAHVTVVTESDIARSGARTTLDVLQQLAGVSVMDSRGLGLGADTGAGADQARA